MALYGHRFVNIDALKKWAHGLSANGLSQIDIGGKVVQVDQNIKGIINNQIQDFSSLVNLLNEGDDWRSTSNIFSPLFTNAFIRVNNGAIRLANYYECLLTPSNLKTSKKILRGFTYTSCGAIDITNDSGKMIASIGCKSDLIWSVFYDYFVNTNEYEDTDFTYEDIDHTYANHESILSIQLYDVENVSLEKIVAMVNEILLQVSMEYDMDFKIHKLDAIRKQAGEDTIRKMQFNLTGFDEIPTLYLNNAISASDERLAFLSYYQVMEFFFVRAQNKKFISEYSKLSLNPVNHSELHKILNDYKNTNNERESLKLVLSEAIDVEEFKDWVKSNPLYVQVYGNSQKTKKDVQKEKTKIISDLTKRVYDVRCSIVHAKGDDNKDIAIPSLCAEKIEKELPLLKYLSFRVISYWSGK